MMVIAALILNWIAFAQELKMDPHAKATASAYLKEKEKILVVEQQSRAIMSTLYEINLRMKNMSKKRDILNNKMMGVEGNVKILARSIAELESKIKKQRRQLTKRLKAIYMLGDEGVARIVFSSANAQELDQSLKYLKMISDHDYARIKDFEKNLKLLHRKRGFLKNEVQTLAGIKEKLRLQEQALMNDQKSKSGLLEKMNDERQNTISKLAHLRIQADERDFELFNISFYEQKGKLNPPIKGFLKQAFGLVENEDFHYRLGHKGHLYLADKGVKVLSVFNGRIAYVGPLEGYGQTVVVDHGDHYYTVYSSLEKISVNEGEKISANGIVGHSSGRLYFEIRHFSDAIDPQPWLQGI